MIEQFIGIFLMIIAIKSFYDAFNSAKPIDLDNIELFRVYNVQENISTTNKEEKKSETKIKKNKQEIKPKSEVNDREYTQLQQDCYDALTGLGVKSKKEKTFLVNNTFNNHNPSTIQEFLQICMSK